MLEWIFKIDTKVFLLLNSMNHEAINPIMHFLSYNLIPLICILLAFLIFSFQRYKLSFLIPFLFLITTFGLSDTISSKGFKENIKRFRPMHSPALKGRVNLGGKPLGGGKYGFVSSHASNAFAICTFIFLLFGKRHPKLRYTFIYAATVSYSRIYFAKHYPLDLICGALLGVAIALIMFRIFILVERRWLKVYSY